MGTRTKQAIVGAALVGAFLAGRGAGNGGTQASGTCDTSPADRVVEVQLETTEDVLNALWDQQRDDATFLFYDQELGLTWDQDAQRWTYNR